MKYFIGLLCIIGFLQIPTFAEVIKKRNNSVKNQIVTVEDIVQNSKATEERIIALNNLDFNTIYKHSNLLLDYKLFEKNVIFIQKILSRSIELYGLDSLETKIAYLKLAYAYLHIPDKKSAKFIYELVDETKENKSYEKNIILAISIFNTKGNYELLSGNFRKSLKYFSKVQILLKKHNLDINITYVRALHSKAFAEHSLGNHKKALKLMKKGSNIIQKNNIVLDYSELGNMQITLSGILIKLEKYQQASSQVMHVLKTIKDSGNSDLPITIELINIFNASLIFTNSLTSVVTNANSALEIQKKIGYKDNDTIVSIYMFKGLAEKKLKKYKESKKSYSKALLLLEQIKLDNEEKRLIKNKIEHSVNEIKEHL